jgi:hypothetical protein
MTLAEEQEPPSPALPLDDPLLLAEEVPLPLDDPLPLAEEMPLPLELPLLGPELELSVEPELPLPELPFVPDPPEDPDVAPEPAPEDAPELDGDPPASAGLVEFDPQAAAKIGMMSVSAAGKPFRMARVLRVFRRGPPQVQWDPAGRTLHHRRCRLDFTVLEYRGDTVDSGVQPRRSSRWATASGSPIPSVLE